MWTMLVAVTVFAEPASYLLARVYPQSSDIRQQSVTAMPQTRDGCIWIGTGKGLIRFDGVAFTAFTSR